MTMKISHTVQSLLRKLGVNGAMILAAGLMFGAGPITTASAAWNSINAEAPTSMMKGDPSEKIEKRVTHMTKALGLTEQQASQVKQILEANMPKMKADHKALKDATDANRASLKAQFKADREATQSQIKGILTPDQQKKFAEMAEHHKHD